MIQGSQDETGLGEVKGEAGRGQWGLFSLGNANLLVFKLNADEHSRNEPFRPGPEFGLYPHFLLFHIHRALNALQPGNRS